MLMSVPFHPELTPKICPPKCFRPPGCCIVNRVAREVRIPGRSLDLWMTQQPCDHGQARLGQRQRLGQGTEWRLEGEFGEDERTWRAGYGYRLGSGLTFTTEASRSEPANDNAPEHALVLRASMRW